MGPIDELVPILKKLRLSGVLQTFEMRLRQAVDGELSHAELILRLLTDEAERRDGKQIQLRVSRAGFEHHKSNRSAGCPSPDVALSPQLCRDRLRAERPRRGRASRARQNGSAAHVADGLRGQGPAAGCATSCFQRWGRSSSIRRAGCA